MHDMGGMHGFGPVVVDGCERVADEPWEHRIFGLSAVIDATGIGAGSGRPIREELPPGEYLRQSYYERWVFAVEQKVLRKGTISDGEVDEWVQRLGGGEPVPTRSDPALAQAVLDELRTPEGFGEADRCMFAVGDRVRVRRMRPAGHTRCPRYVRGAEGGVEAIRGADVLPDIGPYRGPVTPVYAVSFCSDDLFGPSDDPAWKVILDLFETYLEAA